MTSKIKVDNINKVSDDSNIINKCGTDITMGQNGDTVIIPNGVTEQVQSGGAIQVQSGGSITIASGATITNNGTAVGLGRTGTVDWITTPKTTGTFTAVSGEGYFLNTSGGVITANLPAGVAGAIVSLADYAATWQTSAVTVNPNGTDKFGSINTSVTLNTEGQSVTFVFVDSTQGWINTMDSTSNVRGNAFICASVSGACNTLVTAPCCANVKIATFTGPGDFTVLSTSATAAENTVGYLVVAGGAGGGGACAGGGGGAGGFREGRNVPVDNFTASPLVANAPTNAITVTAQTYPIVVGAGGGGGGPGGVASNGNVSTFGSITSTGGGRGGTGNNSPPVREGQPGGSGGGGGHTAAIGGIGNTPPVSPPQGNTGATSVPNSPTAASDAGGGGGGSGAVGTPGATNQTGGAGVSTSISSSSVARGGGGGGSNKAGGNASLVAGGVGGGGRGGYGGPPGGGPNSNGLAATINTGGGGGAGGNGTGAAGGSGIVIIRYKFQ